MDSENQALGSQIKPETPDSPVTIDYAPRSLKMFYVLDQELESIGSTSLQCSIWLAFFGAAFGAMLTLWVTISTVEIKNQYAYAAYWAGALVSTIGVLCFGVLSARDLLKARKQIMTVKKESASRGQPT